MGEIDISTVRGLTEEEAARRLRTEGPNEIPSARRRGLLQIAWGIAREPMFVLLVACGAIYLLLGEVQEALMLLGFVFVVMGITLYQERKTERALDALRALSSPRALIIRDGRRRRVPGREVVRDDILILAEGDRVPADAVVLSAAHLAVDESLLTGESVPVLKVSSDGRPDRARPGGDDQPFVFAGTLVVRGGGIARVMATGPLTEIGRIGKALERLGPEATTLQLETAWCVKTISIVGLVLCAVVVLVYGLFRADWLHGVLAGLTLAMAILPEEFPVVLTIFLALGAWRMARRQVLTRRIPAIEAVGSVSVLCSDKTGTLTENRMEIRNLVVAGDVCDVGRETSAALPERFHPLVEFGILASQRDPFDPMERAFHELGARALAGTEHIHNDWVLVREYPLSPQLLAVSHVWRSPGGEEYVIAAKGAPEAIAHLCHLDRVRTRELTESVEAMASDGLRVLGVARAYFRPRDLPGEQHDFSFEFLGLVGLADPVRPSVPAAVEECRTAGIRVIMITGDHPATAEAIARQAGLTPGGFLSGPEMEAMDDAELRRRLPTTTIFARAVPEQKLRLVEALKAEGEVVAMTGDGVNDAPALKAADVGIAMGRRGTDVAREASALVLLDDDFSSIVAAVRMGRRVFDNLQKAVAYIVAIHVPIAGLSLVPVMLGWPIVLQPVHIVFLELLIDPACSVVFEAEEGEDDLMRRPPRPAGQPLFSRGRLLLALLQGASVLLVVLAVFGIALLRQQGDREARALAFTTLIVGNLGLIFINCSWTRTLVESLRTPSAAARWVYGGGIALLLLVLYVPPLRELFHFSALHVDDLAICFGAGLLSVFWFEGLKALRRRSRATRRSGSPDRTGGPQDDVMGAIK
jgi:Ca2+-transporting ATPase